MILDVLTNIIDFGSMIILPGLLVYEKAASWQQPNMGNHMQKLVCVDFYSTFCNTGLTIQYMTFGIVCVYNYFLQ